MLVVNVFGSIEAASSPLSSDKSEGEAQVVSEMRAIFEGLDPNGLGEEEVPNP